MNAALAPEERAKDLLDKMDLNEKIRQLGCTMAIPMIPGQYQDLKGGIGVSIIMGGSDPAHDLEKIQKYVMEIHLIIFRHYSMGRHFPDQYLCLAEVYSRFLSVWEQLLSRSW